MIHGCSGPLVFALGGFIAIASSRLWRRSSPGQGARGLGRLSVFLFALSIAQLFVGAHLRHSLPSWSPVFFMSLVHTHLLMASLILLAVIGISVLVRTGAHSDCVELRGPANALMAIVLVQILLGVATWVANYATPWVELSPWLARYTVQGKGYWESMIVTGHQATGSLLILCSVWMVCRSFRRIRDAVEAAPSTMEVDRYVQKVSPSEAVSVGIE
jgi:heme a synthase